MAGKKLIISNKSNKPDNIVMHEAEIYSKCEEFEALMPRFMRSFFIYLRGNVLPMTRLAYLRDINFFFEYLINQTDLTSAEKVADIKASELAELKAMDINLFIDYCRHYSIFDEESGNTYVYENSNKTLARKKSSLSVMFKQLYRDEILPKNITDGFDPIRVQKAGEKEIKALQDDEVMLMLDAVTNGTGLTKQEYNFWKKTKKRDKAILMLFITYGLRLSELWQLNIDSFNFNRGEFIIYRKRGKESTMPLNKSVSECLQNALFLSLQGKRMTERQLRQLVKKYTSIALHTSRDGGYSPHKLRATTATSLIGRGNSIYDVAALLDHEQVTTTQLYAQHKKNVKRNLVNEMEWEEERKEGSIQKIF